MTFDAKAEFLKAWDAKVTENLERSPSYKVEDFVVTGRAPAPYGRRNLDWWRDKGPGLVESYVEWRKQTRWDLWELPDEGKPAIEWKFAITLPGDLPVIGFVDRIFVTPVGEIVVVDIKTGSRMPEVPEQLGLYATAVELIYGKQYRPSWGFFWDANKGTHSAPLNLDMYDASYLGNAYQDVVRGISAGSFPAKPANRCVDWCSVSQFCAAVGGAKAAGVDPLLSA